MEKIWLLQKEDLAEPKADMVVPVVVIVRMHQEVMETSLEAVRQMGMVDRTEAELIQMVLAVYTVEMQEMQGYLFHIGFRYCFRETSFHP